MKKIAFSIVAASGLALAACSQPAAETTTTTDTTTTSTPAATDGTMTSTTG